MEVKVRNIAHLNADTNHGEREMKKLLLTALLIPTMASANNCDGIARLAEAIMEARHAGGEMSEMMAMKSSDKNVDVINKTIVQSAFERPRMRSPENIKYSIQEFKNDWYLACYKESQK